MMVKTTWTNKKRWLVSLMTAAFMMTAGNFAAARDALPPEITVTPADGKQDAGVDSTFIIAFHEQVKLADGKAITSRNAASLFQLKRKDNHREVAAKTTWSASKKTLAIKPVQRLDYGTGYILTIPAGKIKDNAGNENMAKEVEVKTEDLEPPFTVRFSPTHQAKDVPVDSLLSLELNKQVFLGNKKKITNTSIQSVVKLTNEKNKRVSFTGKWDEQNRIITIDPAGNLESGATYTISLLENKLIDRQGAKNQPISSQFTTRAHIDAIPPTVTVTPAHGADGVKLDTKITLQFAENVQFLDGAQLSSQTVKNLVQLRDLQGVAVAYTATWNKSNRTITLKAKGKWQKYTTYTVHLPANQLKDLAGNANQAVSVTFATGGR